MEVAPIPKTPILNIIGMHRSGTSLTASLLQSAGLHLGDRLMGGSKSNLKGHFENLDFFEFHRQVLRSQGLNEDGWTLQEKIEVEEIYLLEAKNLISQNQQDRLWGWKDPRTTLFLEFWAKLLTEANFLLVYRSPWDVIDSLYRRGDSIFQKQPDLAPQIWLHYNQKIIDFYHQFTDRCILVNIQTSIDHFELLVSAINQKFNLELSTPTLDIYESSLIRQQPLESYRPTLIKSFFPEVLELYQQLEENSWQPNNSQPDLSWHDLILSHLDRSWLCQDWQQVNYLAKENVALKDELKTYKSQLKMLEAKLNS